MEKESFKHVDKWNLNSLQGDGSFSHFLQFEYVSILSIIYTWLVSEIIYL